jgi:hypothetical protein
VTIALLHPIDSHHRRALGFMNQTIYFSHLMNNIHIEKDLTAAAQGKTAKYFRIF